MSATKFFESDAWKNYKVVCSSQKSVELTPIAPTIVFEDEKVDPMQLSTTIPSNVHEILRDDVVVDLIEEIVINLSDEEQPSQEQEVVPACDGCQSSEQTLYPHEQDDHTYILCEKCHPYYNQPKCETCGEVSQLYEDTNGNGLCQNCHPDFQENEVNVESMSEESSPQQIQPATSGLSIQLPVSDIKMPLVNTGAPINSQIA